MRIGTLVIKKFKTGNKRFVIGIDRAKMRLYDCEQAAQEDILDSGQEEEYNDDDKKTTKSKLSKLNFS